MNINELKIEVSESHQQECIFKKVPASKLRLDDEFMKYQPRKENAMKFKWEVERAIKGGLKDFWRPVCDPSFDDDGCICYEIGKKPAVGQTYNWWEENAKKYSPESGSRLGTKSEYIAFLAVLIKELVASGKSAKWAWNAVCNDSEELGHYSDSVNSKQEFEDTGSREICGFFDLSNTAKLLAVDKNNGSIWKGSGTYDFPGDFSPLANLYPCSSNSRYRKFYRACGWLVFDSCPNC